MPHTPTDAINRLFEQMDLWRHLPSYQLERRADLFFSLYLTQVLEQKTRIKISPTLIPEFPIQKSIIDIEDSNRSFKVDYVVLSDDGTAAFLIELKTDMHSRTEVQDDYLNRAKRVGFNRLLEGVLCIFQGNLDRRIRKKYLHLLNELERAQQLIIPEKLNTMAHSSSFQGIRDLSRAIEIISKVQIIEVIYIQPLGDGENIVNFEAFADIIAQNQDPFAARFARSLRQWSRTQAGDRPCSL